MPSFIDTHCHFDFPPFYGREEDSLAQAASGGVNAIIVPAVAADRFDAVLALAQRFTSIYAALGMHPIAIADHEDEGLDRLERYLRQAPTRLVAIGEIGLDNFMPEPEMARQLSLLEAQLVLAARYDLPVILHSRRTHDQLAMLLRRRQLPRTGVVHGFAGSYQQADAFIRLGYAIGIGGTITYPRASKTRRAVANLPLTSLLLETDSPDMPVCGFQGQPNRPERLTIIFQSLCELRAEPPEQIAETLLENSVRLFHLAQ